MRKQLKDLTPVHDYVTEHMPGLEISEENWGGMMSARHFFVKGTDFTELLKGQPDDLCQVAHWGYCLKGRIKMIYGDGSTEHIIGGDLFYMQPPHNFIAEEDSEIIQFSSADVMHGQAANVGAVQTV